MQLWSERRVAKNQRFVRKKLRNSKEKSSHSMNPKIKAIIGVGILVTSLAFALSNISRNKLHAEVDNIKPEPAFDIKNKYKDYVNVAPSCPSSAVVPVSLGTETEFDHCKDCQMGVYFKKNEEELECSYCLKLRKA